MLEPRAWRYMTNGVHTFYTDEEPPDDAYDEGSLVPLFALPDLLAVLREVTPEMTNAAIKVYLDMSKQHSYREIFLAMLDAFERQVEGE